MTDIFKVMFVCTGNSCRSPMAEGALRKLLENKEIKDISVCSSGTAAASGFPATAYAIEAALIWDADISNHHSQPLTAGLIDEADLILAMSPTHCSEALRIRKDAQHKTFLLRNYPEPGCNGDKIEDPIGGSLDLYNKAFIEIGEELGRIIPEIIKAAEEKREM